MGNEGPAYTVILPMIMISRRTLLAGFMALGLMTAPLLHAQSVEWLRSDTTDFSLNPGYPGHLVATSPGEEVVAARFWLTGQIYGTDVYGEYIIDRYNDTGVQDWFCGLGGDVLVQSLVVGADSTIYVAGTMLSGIQLCDGSVIGYLGAGTPQCFLMAVKPGGSIVFSRNLSVDHPDAQAVPSLDIAPDGTLWYGLEEFDQVHVISVDAAGEDDQVRTITTTRTLGGIAFDPWGGLYVTGSTGDMGAPMTFGGLSVPVPEPYMMFVLRLNALGAGQWVELAHDVTFQRPDVATDPFGNAFVSCGVFDTMSFGGVQFHGPDWVSDVFITKVDSLGDFLWGVESAPSSGPITGDLEHSKYCGIATDGAGRVYLTGTTRGQVFWGNGVVSDGLTLGSSTQTVVCFDGSGLPQWANTSIPVSAYLNAQNITSDANGVVHFASHVWGSMEFPPFIVNSSGPQAFAAGRIEGTSAEIHEGHSPASFIAAPSPFTHEVGLIGPVPGRVTVMDATGRVVFNDRYTGPLGAQWAPGVYTLTIIDGGVRQVARVVKQ